MLFEDIARASVGVAATPKRLEKVARLAEALGHASPDEVPVAVAHLSGDIPGGTIGVGWASLRDPPPPAATATLRVLEVQRAFEELRSTAGSGSQTRRRAILHDLLARATAPEQAFLRGLMLGEIRQGALEGLMVEAVARASGVGAAEVRRAAMLAGDLAQVARTAVVEGPAGLARFRLTVLRPVQPMLAQSAEGIADALARIGGPAAMEWKLDGARLQVHRLGSEVRAFTRNLADVTDRVPEVVESVLGLPVRSVVLDGEAIALRATGRPHRFQSTMSRFGSQLEVERHRAATPLSAFFFDCLHLDGEDLLDRPERARFEAMAARIPEGLRIPRIETDDRGEAEAFFEQAIQRGHEGVMVKAPGSPYEAGRRGATWLKVKRADTLDLVVLAAEWGHGRRRGLLSNLHLGARDPASGGFVMLGKTFKGMTDAVLAWQTERFQQIETGRDPYTVYVRPELVVEVAFDGVQASTRYPAGLALRFARIKGYRPDKRPEDADTIDAVRAIHARGADETG
ncbi:MAG TPA: ATP-dependent DNA ligase [Actinomycetota bacterium]